MMRANSEMRLGRIDVSVIPLPRRPSTVATGRRSATRWMKASAGSSLLTLGVIEGYTAWRIRREVTGEWILGLAGAARIIGGAIVFFMPIVGAVLTMALVATWSIIGGITALVLGYRQRQFHQGTFGTDRTAAARGA